MKSTSPTTKIKSRSNDEIDDNSFPVVAIGASAGGLEAITELLKNLAPGTGMAFIYVPHLSPDHKSILTSLLSRSTSMKVQEVTDKVLMRPDNFYVIPPGKEMAVLDGHIKLTPRRKDRVLNLPIDTFFCSLAEKHKEGAIGIILSGSASDGTRGLSAIKEAGGLTFAQDDSAKFSSMPKSAITAGAVDFVLSPKEIARELTRLSKQDYVKHGVLRAAKEEEIENSDLDLKIILNLLHKETSVDFSHYKMATIKRRILRRMLLYKIKSLKEYAKLMAEKSEEINILYQDLLINVTSFFRDTDVHQYLKTSLLPKLLKSKKQGEALRIWVAACSTGEEAYSIAMTILEIQSNKSINAPVQIFATDLSTQAITKARIGEYPKHDLDSVSPKRLQRFYTKSGNNYRVSKVVRDMCVFAPHNILRDPPFSRVDFISCCNLLIYLDTPAQKKAIATFHYAVKDGGYLMLGKSETIGTSGHLFTSINSKFKIYARKKNSGAAMLPELLPRLQPAALPAKNNGIKSLQNPPVHHNDFDSSVDAVLLSRYIPPSVVINHAMEILQFRGATDLYLRHPSGKASLNILKMTAPEIAFELRNAIQKAIKTTQPVIKEGIERKVDATLRLISIEVTPLAIELEEPLLLVVFTEQRLAETLVQTGSGIKSNSATKDRRIKKLEEELVAARADAHSFAQDQQAFTEELQSANEEVVSSNEELQSVNEELETSKEEIESTNEELITTNQELQTRNDLLNESYLFSEAIITTMHEPMIILDKNLRVKSANKSFYKHFRVLEEETEGVLLYDLGNKQWDIPRLRELLEDIIPKNSNFHDFEVTLTIPGLGEKIMLLNASRIIQKTHHEQLILLAIADFTEARGKAVEFLNREKELLKENAEHFHFIADAMPQKVWTADAKGNLNYFNKCWVEYTGLSFEELKDWGWTKVIHPDDRPETKKRWLHSINTGKNFEMEHRFLNTERIYKWHLSRGLAFNHESGKIKMWIGTNTEINDQKLQKEELEKAVGERTYELQEVNKILEEKNEELEKMNKELQAFAYVSSHDLQEPLRKIQTFAGRILENKNENLTDNSKNNFQKIQDAAKRMQQLIEDLLAFSKVNATERKFESIDLNKIIEEVKEDLKEIIEEKHAIIEIAELCPANIIPFQFRQLMQNLIGNALKFSKKDIPPHIIIISKIVKGSKLNNKKLSPEKNYCHIMVKDNGIGFEHKFRDRIFEVFQKLHGKEEYEGTGIGLAIVKKIVENHNGIITASSEVNKGATFSIYIPQP